MYTLYLASESLARKELLGAAGIPFTLIAHSADESKADLGRPLEQVVTDLALLKMDHVVVPKGTHEGEIVFVVTADTMTLKGGPGKHEILGKPKDRDDARRMIILSRQRSTTGTAFCVQKRIWLAGEWKILEQQTGYGQAWIVIDIPDEFINYYLDGISFLKVSGAIKVGGICEQFTKDFKGSFSAIKGLPMYELREALYSMGFYNKNL